MAEIQVETFEATEGTENIDDIQELVDELGLEGQKKLVHPSGERNPFRHMTLEEELVYSTILPKVIPLKQYDRGPIPKRVLEIAREARRHFQPHNKEDTTTGLFVWCPNSAADRDPLLVGVLRDKEVTYSKDKFILARWGEVLEAFPVLRERAAKQKLVRYKATLQAIAADAARALEQVKQMDGDTFFAAAEKKGSFPHPSAYGML